MKKSMVFLVVAAAVLSIAGCGSGGPNLPNGGKGLLGGQPMGLKGKHRVANEAAGLKAAEKAEDK